MASSVLVLESTFKVFKRIKKVGLFIALNGSYVIAALISEQNTCFFPFRTTPACGRGLRRMLKQ